MAVVVVGGSPMLASVRVASAATVGATSVMAEAASKSEERWVVPVMRHGWLIVRVVCSVDSA